MGDPDEFLPVESAGNAAGISPRTLRYWIKGGKLPATEGPRGKLVKLADVLAIAELTGKALARGRQVAGNRQGPARSAGTAAGNVADFVDNMYEVAGDDAEPRGMEPRGNVTILAPTDAARAQLEAVRDEWLRPFVADVERLSKEVGRLTAERDAALAEAARLRAEAEAARGRVDAGDAERDRLLTELLATEAARVTGSAQDARPWWRRWLGLGG